MRHQLCYNKSICNTLIQLGAFAMFGKHCYIIIIYCSYYFYNDVQHVNTCNTYITIYYATHNHNAAHRIDEMSYAVNNLRQHQLR